MGFKKVGLMKRLSCVVVEGLTGLLGFVGSGFDDRPAPVPALKLVVLRFIEVLGARESMTG